MLLLLLLPFLTWPSLGSDFASLQAARKRAFCFPKHNGRLSHAGRRVRCPRWLAPIGVRLRNKFSPIDIDILLQLSPLLVDEENKN